jgi:hypothetical protein
VSELVADFPVSHCAPCGREVLVHTILDADDRERIRCVACDAEIDPLEVRWVAEPALNELGYGVVGEVGLSGCGKPGCGGGRCGRALEPEPNR